MQRTHHEVPVEIAYGGRYVPETLMEPLRELQEAWATARRDPAFAAELARLLRDYVGRPTPLGFAARLSERLGCHVWLKREYLCHTGAHKINNAIGQALLVKRMGKTRVVAETGAGQHGVATATVCALMGLECVVYMGTEDMARQAPNVARMRLLGAEVRGVSSGTRTLKDAINEAMRDWVTNVRTTHYLLGSVLGSHPYPAMVRDFQAVIGREAPAGTIWTDADGRRRAMLPSAFVSALEMCVNDYMLMNAAVQPFVDTAISKTVNVPADYPFDAFKDLYFEGWKAGLKGIATYRPNDVLGAVLEAAPPVAPAAEPQDFDTADPDRRIRLERAHQPPLASLRWPGRPELSNGNPCWPYVVRHPLGDFAVFIGQIGDDRPCPFDVWINGAEQPRVLGAIAKTLSMDMRTTTAILARCLR